jgi:hypothetical protein
MRVGIAALMGALCLVPSAGADVVAAPRGPFLLVGLPSLGAVSWRCAGPHGRYALGFSVPERGATTVVRLAVRGRVVERATVDPGEARGFPPRGLEQLLEVTQFTGAGTLQATVSARFDRRPTVSHCYAYSPPALIVRVTLRR